MKYRKLVAGIALAAALVYGCSRPDTVLGASGSPAAAEPKPEVALTGQVAGDLPSESLTKQSPKPDGVLTGKAAWAEWTTEKPGVRRHITSADLPEPYATESARNFPRAVPRPEGAWRQVPAGFVVTEFATGLLTPRQIITAPNGDLFITESQAGRVHILRGMQDGHPAVSEVFVVGLRQPFGLAFYPNGANPQYLYVGNTDEVVRFPYKNGDLKASAAPEHICDLPGGGRLAGGGHWTRDVKFSPDNKTLLVSIGSFSNVHERPDLPDERRANILAFTPDGKNERVYASGIRNAVTMAFHPRTGDLWCSVNERDGLGNDLVPDYLTRVKEGGFYGWPWYYLGPHQDPRHPGAHPELKDKVLVPDVKG